MRHANLIIPNGRDNLGAVKLLARDVASQVAMAKKAQADAMGLEE